MSRIVKKSSELKSIPAYRLEYEEYVPDCKGLGMVFRHKKSGARICVISNDDENKVFMISFRTNPTDDTGVPHIIEHSVLCGSKKFTPKDPFMELAKGSLNTFLNAFTYADKTCYPVASCNDRDFANLMDVYMDAVLHPNIYSRPEIFKQEGWHYEIGSKDDPITINGVVYSEMKGAFSNAEDRLERSVNSALFPDTTYGVESGGDPKFIPGLSYEQFLDFHRNFYHPSNSYIYLYGDMDVEERLNWLDEEYLSGYDLHPVDSEVKMQEPIGTKVINAYYPLSEDTPEENGAHLEWSFTIGTYDEREKIEAMDILSTALFNMSGAPVKEALIKAGIGQDIQAWVDEHLKQPTFSVMVRNTEADKLPEMERILRSELEKIVKNGIEKKSLLAAVNGEEFHYCEADYGRTPKGLQYGKFALKTWLYDDTRAFDTLHLTELFPVLRERIETGYYEDLVESVMLNAPSQVFCCIAPKKGLGAEDEKALADRLAAMKASMSGEELDRLIADTQALHEYQSEPSTPEELMTLPLLTRDDIRKKVLPVINEEFTIGSEKGLFHEIETNGILYLKFLFNIGGMDKELIPYLGLAMNLIGDMDTLKRSYMELNNEVFIYTGGIITDTLVCSIPGTGGDYIPYVAAGGKVMHHSLDRLLELTHEELFETDYSSLTRVRELLNEMITRYRYSLSAAGSATALRRASSYISHAERFNDISCGYDFFEFISRLSQLDDEGLEKEIEKVKEVVRYSFTKGGLLIDLTCSRDLFPGAREKLAGFVASLPDGEPGKEIRKTGAKFDLKVRNEAFKTSGEVNYLAAVGSFTDLSIRNRASLNVLMTILSTDYLWNRLRVLGGAYGCGFSASDRKELGVFYSYRDPHIAETLEVYRMAPDFVAEFEADEREMTKFVIGTMGDIDKPLSPLAKGGRSLGIYIDGRTESELQELRDAMISTSVEDIRASADTIRMIMDTGAICAVGCESSINANADMFGEVRSLY